MSAGSHLCGRFYVDPGWQHHAGVQGLGSHPEVDDASVVHGPDVLTATAHTHQTNVALKKEAVRRELDPHAGKKHPLCSKNRKMLCGPKFS